MKLLVRIGKRSPEWRLLKDLEGEKPAKIEQRKVQGLEGEPQVKQTALLAGPVYIGPAQGEKIKKKKYICGAAKLFDVF